MKDKTLKDVDSTLMEAGGFLDDIAKTQKKQDCLKNFCACQNLIKWLKETAPKGLNYPNLVCVLQIQYRYITYQLAMIAVLSLLCIWNKSLHSYIVLSLNTLM